MDHVRLVQTSQMLTATLEESLKARLAARDDRPLSEWPLEDLISRTEQMLARLKTFRDEQPSADDPVALQAHITREEQAIARMKRQLAGGEADDDSFIPEDEGLPGEPSQAVVQAEGLPKGAESNGSPTASSEASQPSPDRKPEPASRPLPESESCPFCQKSPSECTDLKATRREAWAAIHYDHPDEVKKRDEAATAEMFESLRRHGPARY
jgi:hypothetical protein